VKKFRVVGIGYKFMYFGAWLIVELLLTLLSAPVLSLTAAVVANELIAVAILVIGVRSFRGKGEDVEAPRPWWRMSARPTFGYFAGIILIAASVAQMASLIGGRLYDGPTLAGLAVSIPAGILAGVAYLNSSVRLTRASRATR
jgi:hypothetical protein